MAETTPISLQARLDAVKANNPERVSRLVELILEEAVRRAASDVHFEPTARAVEIRFRLDGVLHSLATIHRDLAPNVVARLKVLAELLTYRMDIPQEGSILSRSSSPGSSGPGEGGMRVSTFPTIQGEKVVVRLFDPTGQVLELEELGLPGPLYGELIGLLRERTGAVLLTGPSGSGKTTTIYACLRHLVRVESRGRNIVTIEDPVEQVIEGVSQSQARPGTEFDFARGLRSLLRQDPEVIMIGEIRDRETAEIGIQAALTGHLVFSTLHTGSACGVINRLLDMQIEPYLLTSSLKAVLNQRLVRRLCEACRNPAAGCEQCAGTGYRGRLLLAELLLIDDTLREAILARADTNTLETIAQRTKRSTLWTAVEEAVAAGLTTTSEIERVLGPRPGQGVPPGAH
jgi:general secretion pathway protein E